jgi:hypothetical protein
MSDRLFIARSLSHARQNAENDLRWRQTGVASFIDAGGNNVLYVPQHLSQGFRRGTEIYLGKHWFERKDAKEIERAIVDGHFIVVQPPQMAAAPKTEGRNGSQLRRIFESLSLKKQARDVRPSH